MSSKIPSLTLNNGYKMPILGLGTLSINFIIDPKSASPEQMIQLVKDAIDAGYRHFDGAFIYQNEKEVGAGIRAKIEEGVVKREDLFVVSKLWNTHHHPDDVVKACKKTLTDLGLSYVDLYLIHWPMGYQRGDNIFPLDPKTGDFIPSDVDYVDTWKSMEECVSLGLARSIGLSNFNADQIFRILGKCKVKPVVNQVECHPYLGQTMLENFCRERGIHLVAYSALGSQFPGAGQLLDDPKIKEIAKKCGKSEAQVALRFLVQRDIAVVPKSSKKNRLLENTLIFDFALGEDDMNTLYSLEKEGGGGRVNREEKAKTHKYYPFNNEYI